MLTIAEKSDFLNARAVKICPKVTALSNGTGKKPCIYGMSRKTGHGMDIS
jgi:hypothetical protein